MLQPFSLQIEGPKSGYKIAIFAVCLPVSYKIEHNFFSLKLFGRPRISRQKSQETKRALKSPKPET